MTPSPSPNPSLLSSSCWPDSAAKRLILKKPSSTHTGNIPASSSNRYQQQKQHRDGGGSFGTAQFEKSMECSDSNRILKDGSHRLQSGTSQFEDDDNHLEIQYVSGSNQNTPSIFQIVQFHRRLDHPDDMAATDPRKTPRIIDVIHVADVIGAKAERMETNKDHLDTSNVTYLLEIYVYERQRMTKTGLLGRWCFPSSSSLLSSSSAAATDTDSTLGYRFPCHRTFWVTAAHAAATAAADGSMGIHDPTTDQLQQDVTNLVRAIQTLARSSTSLSALSLPNFLVMINPFSGTKQALSVYQATVQPMLQQANMTYDTFITQYAGHAYQRICNSQHSSEKEKKLHEDEKDTEKVTTQQQDPNEDVLLPNKEYYKDISQYEGIILLGGDGILFEVLQALKHRSDWTCLIRKLKFGIIGCGTCNGLAASLLHARKVCLLVFIFIFQK